MKLLRTALAIIRFTAAWCTLVMPSASRSAEAKAASVSTFELQPFSSLSDASLSAFPQQESWPADVFATTLSTLINQTAPLDTPTISRERANQPAEQGSFHKS